MQRWTGKVAVVTGASAGIGESILRQLVKHGMKVVAIARRLEKMQKVADELKNEKGSVHPLKVDLRKEKDIVAAFAWIKSNLGGVDVLINNAGVAIRTRVMEGDMEAWHQMYDVNIFAVGICCREALKSMTARRVTEGHIININSLSGHELSTLLSQAIYSCTKHSLTVMTEALRRELVEINSPIKVSSISPGRVMTDMIAPNGKEQAVGRGAMLDCDSVAGTVIYALSTSPKVQISEIIVRPVGDMLHKTPPQQL